MDTQQHICDRVCFNAKLHIMVGDMTLNKGFPQSYVRGRKLKLKKGDVDGNIPPTS